MSAEVELAWAAGFLDGEGYFGARKTKFNTFQYSIQVHQKGIEVLGKVKNILGGEIYKVSRGNNIYKWSVQKKELVEESINKLWIYIYIRT